MRRAYPLAKRMTPNVFESLDSNALGMRCNAPGDQKDPDSDTPAAPAPREGITRSVA